MITPNDINLIIFDMDGTIIASLPAVYESIKRAFAKLGWPVNFTAEEINKFFGVSTASTKGGLYEFITPPDSGLSIPEVRERVRYEYDGVFREMALAYPGVKDTLTILRRRGYKLAQYTNAATKYLNIVMSSLNIREYFDYIECIEDNNLTKPQLVRKIREKFGGLTAAVVGDRIHDIEAAHETDSLSIGALYGYGEKEPESADITISQFSDLLAIFDRRLPIFEKILQEVKQRKQKDKAFVIGISGIDGAGKTTFAGALEAYLKSKGCPVQAILVDDFHNPKAIRYAGDDQADNYFNKSFNINLIIEKLLAPLQKKRPVTLKLKTLNWETDRYENKRGYTINQDTIVIFEGVFLFRKELAPYIDYKIFLDIPFEESKKRAILRDPQAIVSKYDVKYLPAQVKYTQDYPPPRTADIIIDNTNVEQPRLVFLR
jgi:phosphoglycolate phosphatase-like HAD superfamily hydrolase/uridine kinase